MGVNELGLGENKKGTWSRGGGGGVNSSSFSRSRGSSGEFLHQANSAGRIKECYTSGWRKGDALWYAVFQVEGVVEEDWERG